MPSSIFHYILSMILPMQIKFAFSATLVPQILQLLSEHNPVAIVKATRADISVVPRTAFLNSAHGVIASRSLFHVL